MPDESASEAPNNSIAPTNAKPTRAEAIDASLDAAFKAADIPDEPKPAPARGADGKFKPKGEETPAGENLATATTKDSVEVKADEATEEPKHTDAELRKAIAALQRYKVPKSVLKLAESGDEDTIAHGLHLAKIQADSDDFSTKHKTLQQELDSLKTKKPAANSGVEDGATAPDLLADYLAEALADPEAAKHVREHSAALQKAHQSELAKRDQQIADLVKRGDERDLNDARDALMSDYPDLKDRDTWLRVKKQYDQLSISEDRPDALTRLDHAARIELAPELAKRSKAERDKKHQLRDNGSPSPANRAGEPLTVKSLDDLRDESLDAAMAGDEAKQKSIEAEIKRRQKKD